MYRLPFFEKIGLQIAEKKMGLVIRGANLLCNKQGSKRYVQMLAFRKFCNYRTRCIIRNGGGKNTIPQEIMVSKYDSVLLDLSEFCLDGQSVHPDVIYDQKNECYIMAISQFPFKNDAYEYPILLYSQDAEKWSSRGNCYVRVSPIPQNVLGYHSDPGIVIHKEKLYFFDRKVLINKNGSAQIAVDLYEEGQDFKYKSTIFYIDTEWDNYEKYLSPTMISGEKGIHCWYAERGTEGFGIVHVILNEKWEICSEEMCVVNGLKDNEFIWHLDICSYESILYMAADIRKEGQHVIVLFYSLDKGKTWKRSGILASSEDGFSEKGVYRGSILFRDNEYLLFYSGRNYSEYWQTAKKVFLADEVIKLKV